MDRDRVYHPAPPRETELSNLDPERLDRLDAVLSAILASDVAEKTFAQVIDGQPAKSCFRKGATAEGQPTRERPSDHSLTAFRHFLQQIEPHDFLIAADVLQAYQNAEESSHQLYMRLLEVASLVIHALAGTLYHSFHPNTDVWLGEYDRWSRPYCPVDLYHFRYLQYPCYPYGLLNVVGYWAETQIFGGVLLLEHDNSGSEALAVFIQPQYSDAFEVSSSQIQRLCQGQIHASTSTTASCLPLEAEEGTRYIPITEFYAANVFRDEFSRYYPDSFIIRQPCV